MKSKRLTFHAAVCVPSAEPLPMGSFRPCRIALPPVTARPPAAKADEITVSAPFGRVDLEALKRPRLGGKEPSDDDYRLRFTHTLPTDCDGGHRDRRVSGAPSQSVGSVCVNRNL